MARTNAYQQRGPSTANGIPRSTSNGSSITVASTSSNIGIRRTSSNSSSQLGMVRLSYNSNEIGALQSSRSTSRGNGIDHVPNTMPNNLQPYRCAPGQIQPAGPRVMIGSANYRVQLQSLSEVEEMDVRPEASEGPPKYSKLFPEMEVKIRTQKHVHSCKLTPPLVIHYDYVNCCIQRFLYVYTGATRSSKSKGQKH